MPRGGWEKLLIRALLRKTGGAAGRAGGGISPVYASACEREGLEGCSARASAGGSVRGRPAPLQRLELGPQGRPRDAQKLAGLDLVAADVAQHLRQHDAVHL